jgi:parallel beta-helix repeat protein
VGNRVFGNARAIQRGAAGIQLLSSPANTVSGNISYDNEDSGIGLLLGSNDTLIRDNVVYGNGDHGIDSYGATGQMIIANTVYKNAAAGINVESGSTGATIANNISVENGINSPRTHGDIRVESGSTAGTSMDYDLVYRTARDTLLVWNSVSYVTVASFIAASGQEAHGLQQNPMFRNPAGGDFHLRARSPAIDTANSGVSGQPKTDVEGNPRRNDPAISNTGAGPRKYDDRGAYEFKGSKRKGAGRGRSN